MRSDVKSLATSLAIICDAERSELATVSVVESARVERTYMLVVAVYSLGMNRKVYTAAMNEKMIGNAMTSGNRFLSSPMSSSSVMGLQFLLSLGAVIAGYRCRRW